MLCLLKGLQNQDKQLRELQNRWICKVREWNLVISGLRTKEEEALEEEALEVVAVEEDFSHEEVVEEDSEAVEDREEEEDFDSFYWKIFNIEINYYFKKFSSKVQKNL